MTMPPDDLGSFSFLRALETAAALGQCDREGDGHQQYGYRDANQRKKRIGIVHKLLVDLAIWSNSRAWWLQVTPYSGFLSSPLVHLSAAFIGSSTSHFSQAKIIPAGVACRFIGSRHLVHLSANRRAIAFQYRLACGQSWIGRNDVDIGIISMWVRNQPPPINFGFRERPIQYVSGLETGRSDPTIVTICELAKALGVGHLDLLQSAPRQKRWS
jgi:hypothetical protein